MTPQARLLLRMVIKLLDARVRRGCHEERATVRLVRETLFYARPDCGSVVDRVGDPFH